MRNNLKHALLTCTLAYLIIGVLFFLFDFSQTGWSRIDSDAGRSLLSGLTLILSEFQFWGDFYYLSALVPWLGSSLVLALLLHRFGTTRKRRRAFGGASVGIYYLIMMFVFIAGKIIMSWGQIDINPGDAAYTLFIIWPLAGFGLGYLSGAIADKIVKMQASA